MSFSRAIFAKKTPKTHARDLERWYSSFWHGLVHYICIDRVSVKGASLNSLSRIWPSPWYDISDIRYIQYINHSDDPINEVFVTTNKSHLGLPTGNRQTRQENIASHQNCSIMTCNWSYMPCFWKRLNLPFPWDGHWTFPPYLQQKSLDINVF